MITYLYWLLVIVLIMAVLWSFGRVNRWRFAFIGAGAILLLSWLAYFFHFEQLFVKHYGGVMTITVPEGQTHISATWKDDHLWVENYDPVTNICYFNEYSKGNLLQGKVVIKNCNPQKILTQP